jgi:TRAP-type mannitol/chloroaromatic compound transport system substrate-binding protein
MGDRKGEDRVTRWLLCSVAAALLSTGPSHADPVKLRVQAGFNKNVPVLGETIYHVAERVETGGRDDVHLRLYDAGKLVPTLEIFDAVASGKIDAGYAWPGYWMGKLPATTVFAAVPFGPEAGEYLSWIQEGGGMELWRELYEPHGVVPILCGVVPPEASGWFRKPIEKPEDLVGLKIRYAGLGGKVLERMGASITMLAGSDIFPSLERGVIDATEYSIPTVDRALGFYKVAKHYYFPGWHQPSSLAELLVNAESWAKLAPEQQRYVENACAAGVTWSLARGLASQGEALEFFEAEGVTIHRWSPELLERFRAESVQVMEEAAASDPDFARAWNSLQAFREANAAWRDIAYPE